MKILVTCFSQTGKDKFGKLSESSIILKVLQFLKDNKPEIIGTKKIADGLDYTIIDNNPVDGYECEYYLQNAPQREAIAAAGKQHLLQYHTHVARVRYVLEKVYSTVNLQ